MLRIDERPRVDVARYALAGDLERIVAARQHRIRDAVRRLEGAVIEWLATRGIPAQGRVDAPGVYVGGAKIAALGLRVRNHATYHGIAVNIAMDLSPFHDIDPCGYPGLAVTQLADLGVEHTVADAGHELTPFLQASLA